MAPGIPYSESVAITLGAGAGQVVDLVTNPDPNAYPLVLFADTTIDADVSSFELGWHKDANFEAFWNSVTPVTLVGVYQAPTSTTYKGAHLAARVTAGGDTAGTRVLCDGEFIR